MLTCASLIVVVTTAQRAAWLWACAIAIVYLPLGFWFAHPNTHFLAATPALLLGCGWALTHAPIFIRRGLLIAQIILIPLILWQQHQRFTRESVARPNTRRSVVEFGFAHQTGLRAGSLRLRELVTNPSNVSVWVNDDPLVAQWYLRDFNVAEHIAMQPPELRPEYVLLLTNPREQSDPGFDIGRSYQARARIRINKRKLVDVMEKNRSQPP